MAMEVKVYCRRRKREKTQQIDHIPKCFQLPRSVSASKPRTDFSLPICSSKDIELELHSSKEIQSSVIVGSSDMSNDKIRDIDDPSSTRSTEPESRRQETPTNGMELTVIDVKSYGKNAQIQPCNNRNNEDRDDSGTVLEFTPNRSQLTENSEVCATLGSVVWAKTGQRWWPAEILGEKSSKSESSTVGFKRHLLVQYFGKNGSAWVDPTTDLSPFEECFEERSCNQAKEFQNALKQALHYKEHPRSCKESSGSPDRRDRLNHHDQLPAEKMTNTGPKMGSRKDPSWKYGVEIEVTGEGGKKGYKYIQCNFCSKVIKGGVKRMKEHLACTHKDVAPCPNVPLEVKNEIDQYLKNFQNTKFAYQRNFEETIESGPYFVGARGDSGSGILSEGINSCPSGSDRGVRGPMDQSMENKGDDTNAKETPRSAKEHRNQVCSDIGRFFFENGIPINCATSPSYFNMLRSVGNYGRGLKPPTMHEMSNWILKKEVKTTSEIVDEIKATWNKTGVSLLLDGWSDVRNRSLINCLVNNQYGTVFLRTYDASDCVKDAQKLFELIDGVIEEIGENIVIQVVTDNTSVYKAAGDLLMEKRKSLYWTPCAARSIDLMLEKIGELPQQKNALLKATRVSNFIHNHQWLLSLTKKFIEKDLLRPAATKFTTSFLTLENMYKLKQPLQMMFTSNEWDGCAWAKKPEGKVVKKIVMDERTFWPSVVYSIKTTNPLVHVLRLVDGETPAMGFIYRAMDEAKEKIANNLDGDVSSYKEIWDIIDTKWECQLNHDLHATAYYLNPRFRWSPSVSEHVEIKYGLYRCMERLINDETMFTKIDNQLNVYTRKQGLFGFRNALSSYQSRPPVIWWDNFGDETPELKAFAIRILGLTCSVSACERNWNTFNQMHTKRRNRLSMEKMNSLMYIMYNKKLKNRFLKKQSLKEEDDPLIVDEVSSDDEWIANANDDDEDDNSDIVSIEANNGVKGACPSSSSRKRKERENSSSSSRAGTDCTGRMRSKRERKRKVHFDEVSCPLYTSRKVRRFKIMRSLGLAAPVGSPFNTP